jgi:imidazolonepropionase
MESNVDLLIYNTSQLLTLSGPSRPRVGDEMEVINSVENGAVAVKKGRVFDVGPTDRLIKTYQNSIQKIDAQGKLLMPGFVDPHTHLVYAGSREDEMIRRMQGEGYLDILKSGGGIHATVQAVRESNPKELFESAINRLNLLMAHGTTTVEIKSGYGLSPEAEEKMLHVIRDLQAAHPVEIVPTFLGAHVVPRDQNRNDYIDWIVRDGLRQFKDLAEFCDVFCEEEAYTLKETETILKAAKKLEYRLKVHAGQFQSLGAAGLAADLGAVSAEHLDHITDDEIRKMKQAGTTAILLPGACFFLDSENYPNARRFIEADIPVALATDFNPGSCPCFSMQMIMALSFFHIRMSIAQCITAATINAAYAINRGDQTGSIEKGKSADLILLDIQKPEQIPYHFGTNLVKCVIKKGQKVDFSE